MRSTEEGQRLVPQRPTAAELPAAIQNLIDLAYSRHQGGKLKLELQGGQAVEIKLRPACFAHDDRDDMVGNILKALGEANEPLTGEKLAEVAGYSRSGAFQRVLKELIETGQIVNARPGYRLA